MITPRDVVCPDCKAKTGDNCVTIGRRVTRAKGNEHATRIKLAVKANKATKS